MKEKELKSWEDFESQVQEVFSLVEALRQREESFSRVSVPLFRGHGDSNFPLQSSLDRIQPNFTLRGYHQLMRKISTIVNNCTDHNWNIPKYEPPTNQFWFVPQAYDFMVYLRHHGFPSPLLDWSRSPYIAAFFAFNSHKNSSSVAIFSFMEVLGQGKTGFGESSLITALGPNVRSHKRHYLQQSAV